MKMKQSQLNSPLPRFLTVEEVAEMPRVKVAALGVPRAPPALGLKSPKFNSHPAHGIIVAHIFLGEMTEMA